MCAGGIWWVLTARSRPNPPLNSTAIVGHVAESSTDVGAAVCTACHEAETMSPVGPADTVFTKVDLHKFTGGVSRRTSHFLGSFGLHETGSSDEIVLRDLRSGQLTTKFNVKSLGFVYSLSVLF